MAVLASEGSGISVRFGAKTFLTSEEWRNGITDSRWKLHESVSSLKAVIVPNEILHIADFGLIRTKV